MPHARLGQQPDLFAPTLEEADTPWEAEPFPDDYIDELRTELKNTLALAAGAATLPWSDFTKAGLAELHFNAISKWLPKDEGAELRRLFAVELDRLYAEP